MGVPQPVDQPFEQLVHSVRDVHVPHPVAQPMMPQMSMPMSTPYMGGNVFGTQALGTTGFGTFGAGYSMQVVGRIDVRLRETDREEFDVSFNELFVKPSN